MFNTLIIKSRWREMTRTHKLKHRSCFLFKPDNKFRILLYHISISSIFDYIILLAILASCVVLTKQNGKSYDLTDPIIIADLSLNLVFAAEALIKIISYGFVSHKNAYLRDPWNFFDFIVVVGGAFMDIVAMVDNGKTTSLKALRLFRVLRPLRLIVKSPNLKVVLDTIIRSFNVLLHVLLFILLIVLLYAITGMELFGDTIYTACIDDETSRLTEPFRLCKQGDTPFCQRRFGTNATCSEYVRDGIELTYFQNIFSSMMTVLQIITMEDWVFVSYDVAFYNSSVASWIYFISLILFGGYFAIDLLMGVLGNQYLRTKECAIIAMTRRRERARFNGDRQQKNTEQDSRLKRIYSRMCRITKQIRGKVKPIYDHKAFFYVINFIVMGDVLYSTYYGHKRPQQTKTSLPWVYIGIKTVLAVFYMAETFIRGISIGMHGLKKSPYFLFSSTITALAVTELLLAVTGWSNEVYVGISLLRAVTLVELFKLTRWWGPLKVIIRSLFQTLHGVVYLFVLLFIVLCNYALLGNQFFGDSTNPDNRTTSGTFDTFSSSLMLTFVMLTGDNWTEIMFSTVMKQDNAIGKMCAVAYFISFVVIGNFILMNVFLGIIVDSLASDFEVSQDEHFGNKEERKPKLAKLLSHVIDAKKLLASMSFHHAKSRKHVNNDNNDKGDDTKVNDGEVGFENIGSHEVSRENLGDHHSEITSPNSSLEPKTKKSKTWVTFVEQTAVNNLVQLEMKKTSVSVVGSQKKSLNIEDEDQNPYHSLGRDSSSNTRPKRKRVYSIMMNPEIMNPIPEHKALFLFDHENELRKNIYRLVTSSNFTYVVCASIVVSCFLMAFDDPLDRNPELAKVLSQVDYFFTALFTLEVILKSIAYGFLLGHKNCYLRSYMNVADFVAVAFSLFSVAISIMYNPERYQFKTIRILRVVRMLKISTTLKRVINCLVNSLQRITYFLVLYILILFIYSVIGVHLYRHTLYKETPSAKNHTFITYQNGKQLFNGTKNTGWNGVELSFNNVGLGMMTLFVTSTLDDWFLLLKRLNQVNGKTEMTAIVFIVSYLVLMSFILMNVFIGFVVVLYHKEKEKDEQYHVLNSSAQECLITALTANPRQMYEHPQGRVRVALWKMVTCQWFQRFSMAMILVNTGFMMTKHMRQADEVSYVQRISNLVFTGLFSLEIVLKLLAFSFKALAKDYWLLFDTIVILGSWIDIVLDELKVSFLRLSIFRLFRVARLAQVMGKGGNLRQLFSTFLKSMKCVPSIACLTGLILYFYAILGMNLFGKIRLDDTTGINENVNFQSFTSTILLLVRVTTLDQWHIIMLTCADVHLMNCADGEANNCGSNISYVYFASFVFVCSYIMTNLFLAFIMDNFVYLTHDWSELDSRHIHLFTAAWSAYDKRGAGYIRKEDLILLLKGLNPPLGNGVMCPDRSIYARILKLRVPVEKDGTVKFNELLLTLALGFLKFNVKNDILREDLQKLHPHIGYDLLDRVVPLSYDPRKFNSTERTYYQRCAYIVINDYCKIKKFNLRAAVRNIKTTCISGSLKKLKPNLKLKKNVEMSQHLKKTMPSVEVLSSRSLDEFDVERNNQASPSPSVRKIKVRKYSNTL